MLVRVTNSNWDHEVRELLEDAIYYDRSEVDEVLDPYRSSDKHELYAFEDEGQFIGLIGFTMDA